MGKFVYAVMGVAFAMVSACGMLTTAVFGAGAAVKAFGDKPPAWEYPAAPTSALIAVAGLVVAYVAYRCAKWLLFTWASK